MAKPAVKDWREWANGEHEAPPLILAEPGPIPKVEIETKEDADLALKAISYADGTLAVINDMTQEEINKAKAVAVKEATHPLEWKKALEKELERWAKKEGKANFPEGKKSLELNFGVIGFRIPRGKIKLLLAVENVVARLKAKKLFNCIRTVEEPDLLELDAYSDEELAAVGCKKTHPKDKFYYEVFRPEVKG